MNKSLLRLFNIEKGEESKVFFLLAQSFFLGVFLATLETGAMTLFKKAFSDHDLGYKISESYVISGGLGVLLTIIYTRLQQRIKFSKLIIGVFLFVSLATLGLRLAFGNVDETVLVFLIFILMGPFAVVTFFLGFWGQVSRLFTLRQGKRLFAVVDTGLILGYIFILAPTEYILSVISVEDTLFISSGALFIAFLIQLRISAKFRLSLAKSELQKTDKIEEKVHVSDYFKNKYLLLIVSLMLLTTMSAFVIHHSFMSVTDLYYPNENDYHKFVSFHLMATMIFSLLFKSFVSSKLMNMYGLRVNLLILPMLLLILSAAIIASARFLGYGVSEQGFIIFFLLVALTKFIAKSIKDSVEMPAFKLLYQPINKKVRYQIQATIDGFVNEFAGSISGLVLLVLGGLSFFDDVTKAYSVLGFVIITMIVVFRLYSQYQQTLKDSLSSAAAEGSEDIFSEKHFNRYGVLEEIIESHHPDKIIQAIKIAKRLYPIFYQNLIERSLDHDSPVVREFVLNEIKDKRLYSTLDALNKRLTKEDSTELLELTAQVVERLYLSREEAITPEHIELLIRSRDPQQRITAAQILSEFLTDETMPMMMELIRDIEPNVRMEAISTAAKVQRSELWPFLINNLSSSVHQSAATAALIALGDKVVDVLDQAFYRSGTTTEYLEQLVKILGTIGGKKSEEKLLNKIDYPDVHVTKQVLLALRNCKFKAKNREVTRVIQALESVIGNIVYNMDAIERMPIEAKDVHDALKEENQQNFDSVYLLLSLLYDPSSISTIRDNIEAGTSESIGYAIEMLDLFIAEELKPLLFPILEDIPAQDKIKRLEVFFPVYDKDHKETLLQILNRDYNTVSVWTKACALSAYVKVFKGEINDDIVATMFNPHQLLQECASSFVYKNNQKTYHEVGKRLNSDEKRVLDSIILSNSKDKRNYLMNKVNFLISIPEISNLGRDFIVQLAESLVLEKVVQGERIISLNSNDDLYFLVKGEARLVSDDGDVMTYQAKSLISKLSILESDIGNPHVFAPKDCVLYRLEEDRMYEFLSKNNELTKIVVDLVNARFVTSNKEIEPA